MGFRGRAAYFIAYYIMKDEQNKLEKWRITNNLMDNGCSRETIEKWFNNYNEISETFFKLDRDGEIDSDIDFGIIKQIPCEKDDEDLDDLFDDDNFNDVKISDLDDDEDLDDPFDDDDLDDFFDSLDDPFFEESSINQENEEDDVKIYKPKKDDFTDDDFGL